MKKTSFTLKSGNSPLKQAYVHASDSSTVYQQTQILNQDLKSGKSTFTNNPATNIIQNLNLKRTTAGNWPIYPVIQENVFPEGRTVTNVINVSGATDTKKNIESGYKKKTKFKGDVNYNEKTKKITTTHTTTKGYFIKRPKMPMIKITPKPAPPVTIPYNTDVQLLGVTMPIVRKKKSKIGQLFANIGGLIPRLKPQFYNSSMIPGFFKITKKGNYQGSLYKKLTKQQEFTQKSNIKIRKSNIATTKYNIASAEKHISKYKDLHGITYDHSFGGLKREEKAIRKAGFSEKNVK